MATWYLGYHQQVLLISLRFFCMWPTFQGLMTSANKKIINKTSAMVAISSIWATYHISCKDWGCLGKITSIKTDVAIKQIDNFKDSNLFVSQTIYYRKLGIMKVFYWALMFDKKYESFELNLVVHISAVFQLGLSRAVPCVRLLLSSRWHPCHYLP